jgi:hypothetical protein
MSMQLVEDTSDLQQNYQNKDLSYESKSPKPKRKLSDFF